MRSLFILLLLVNISYLVWGVAFSEKYTPPYTDIQPDGDQALTLLSEHANNLHASVNLSSPDNRDLDKEDNKNLSPSMAPAATCYSLGPILDENDSKKLELSLKKSGFNPKHKAITDKEPQSYWVYFPSEKSLDNAKAVVEQLKTAKVDDYFIIRKGKYIHAISLGLYNGYNRAKVRVSRLKKLGFNPKVQTRYKKVTRHWLDFQESDAKRLDTQVWENAQKDNPLQKIARPCIGPLPKKS